MRFSKSTTSFAALAVVAAAAVAGCGSSGSGAPAQGNGAEPQKAGAMHDAAATHSAGAESGKANAPATSSAPTASVPAKTIKLTIRSDDEHGRKGPEGTWHDAFLPAGFSVKAGQKVTVVVYNYDEGKHSFTDPGLGLNVTIDEGTEKTPKKTTFSFTAPAKAGQYEWFCDFPCDPWAMTHKGYMRGDVTVS